MEPKTGEIVVVKYDIYVDYCLIPADEYEVYGFQENGSVYITEDDCEEDELIIENYKENLIMIQVENRNEDFIEWWIPFRNDICVLKKSIKIDKQLRFEFFY
jgi:hypothetical protein